MASLPSYSYVRLGETAERNDLNASRDSRTNSKTPSIKIGLVGEARSGRSSFVKAIGGILKGEGKGASVETSRTSKATCYVHPDNPNIELWDLPALGMALYPDTKTYYERLRLKTYDAFLLFTRKTPTINSIRLATRFIHDRKPFLFVRTCVDNDVCDEKSNKPSTFDETKLIEEIRKNILESLNLQGVSGEQIFLINNLKPKELDFERLNNTELLENLGSHQSKWCLPVPRISQRLNLALLSLQENWEKYKDVTEKEAFRVIVRKYMPGLKDDIKENGVEAFQETVDKLVDEWKEAKIDLAIIGEICVGKSSFINALRGIKNHEPEAAPAGISVTTKNPTSYPFKAVENTNTTTTTNTKTNITLWDCPGLGCTAHPDIVSYCKHIEYEKYDAFLIFTATTFSEQDCNLVKYIESAKKPFLLIRTKVDLDCDGEKEDVGPDKYNEAGMLEKCRKECLENLDSKDVALEPNDLFLISNRAPAKWDFSRLIEAIGERLPPAKQGCFILAMLTFSEDIIEAKVKVFKDLVKYVAFFQSNLLKPFTTKRYSRQKDFKLIVEKVEFYRSKLGFPEKATKYFKSLSEGLQDEMRQFYLTVENLSKWYNRYCGDEECRDEDNKCKEEEMSLPWLDIKLAKSKRYEFVSISLRSVLTSMEKTAVKIFKESAANADINLKKSD